MRIAVLGLGKLGSPIAACYANAGFQVYGVDKSARTVGLLQRHVAPVGEPGLQELIDVAGVNLICSYELPSSISFDAYVVIVPTPSDAQGKFSNKYVVEAVREIADHMKANPSSRHPVVVISSTVMPGTCENVIRHELDERSGRIVGKDLTLCYSPEFIAIGSVVKDLQTPDVLMIGSSGEDVGCDTYKQIASAVAQDAPIEILSLTEAEIAKMSVNAYVTMKISWANALQMACRGLHGVDARKIAKAVGNDSRVGNKYLKPAAPYGGPCFPRDNRAIQHFLGEYGALAEATDKINGQMVEVLSDDVLQALPGYKVGVLGLTYKPDTTLTEESLGRHLVERLLDRGLEVVMYDPSGADRTFLQELIDRGYKDVTVSQDAKDAPVVVIATPWAEFEPIVFQSNQIVIDPWGVLQ